MKKWIFMLLLAGSIQGVYAQKTEKKDKFNPNTPLFEELTDVKKKTDKFNLYLNMQGSFDAHFQNAGQLRCKLPRRLRRGSFQNETTPH